MSIIWTIIIGFIAGLVARALKPGNDSAGFIVTTLIGIVGSLAATYLGQAMGWYRAGEGAGFIASVVGAIVLLFVWGMIKRKG
ncbi:MAG: GlsB/YeaQ/YmgE family stress response membrane protein [Variovorax sp.]|nr:MAG: GlsB/YeaQ/YmgE family stress response membrane protein [Variovorax sp.]